ncbi:hypothetical protein LG3211_3463 [Lysobacter gummosus]|nr:hypothetical protein LG3211_3463 [Lysobacter gummosus]
MYCVGDRSAFMAGRARLQQPPGRQAPSLTSNEEDQDAAPA